MAVYQGRYPVLSFTTGIDVTARPGSYVRLGLPALSGSRIIKEVTGLPLISQYVFGTRQYREFTGLPYSKDTVVQGGTGQIKTPRQEPLEITWKTALFDN